jgi:hypothetical protein
VQLARLGKADSLTLKRRRLTNGGKSSLKRLSEKWGLVAKLRRMGVQRPVEPARQTRKLARCQDHLNENQELEVAIFLYRECGLAKVIDEHDIAIDVVYLRVENPASIGRNRQAPIHGAEVAIYIHHLPDLPG